MRRGFKLSRVVREVPTVRVPDLQSVPGLPHAENPSGVDIDPNMVRSLSPVINNHFLLNVLDKHLFPSNEPNWVSGRVHEVEVQWEDFDTESSSRICANALLGNSKVVHDPHVLFHVGDVRGLVEMGRKVDIKVHF
jgi:hypothetical protein